MYNIYIITYYVCSLHIISHKVRCSRRAILHDCFFKPGFSWPCSWKLPYILSYCIQMKDVYFRSWRCVYYRNGTISKQISGGCDEFSNFLRKRQSTHARRTHKPTLIVRNIYYYYYNAYYIHILYKCSVQYFNTYRTRNTDNSYNNNDNNMQLKRV